MEKLVLNSQTQCLETSSGSCLDVASIFAQDRVSYGNFLDGESFEIASRRRDVGKEF